MNPVPYEDFIGKVEHVIPGAGALAEKLGGPAGRQAAGGLLILAALLFWLWVPGWTAGKERDG